jgi:secreted trypsin-like serine protease
LKKLLLLVVTACSLLVVATPANAITYGTPDTQNRYPFVGALVGTFEDGTYPYCSGTLISPTVFLTAAHCDISDETGTNTVYVTFDQRYTSRSKLYKGTFIAHPDAWSTGINNPNDVAVVIFDRAIRGIQPAEVAELGLLDQMKAEGTLTQSTAFTSVGYGAQEPGHKNQLTYLDTREYAVGYFNSLGPGMLHISQNVKTGSGGTCFGDSGGPQFLGDTNIVVSITVTGDMFCKALNTTQRVDIASVQDFLSQYVEL